jgi:hypothetical protein
LEEFFPSKSYHYIDITKPGAVDKLFEIIQNDLSNENIEAIKEARLKILKEYNLWPALEKIILDIRK